MGAILQTTERGIKCFFDALKLTEKFDKFSNRGLVVRLLCQRFRTKQGKPRCKRAATGQATRSVRTGLCNNRPALIIDHAFARNPTIDIPRVLIGSLSLGTFAGGYVRGLLIPALIDGLQTPLGATQ